MNADGTITVSPRHTVRLAQEYHHLIQHPPGTDFVVRTITHRKAGDLPLMSAQLVIAGAETRRQYPLANTYPLHFRKTYFPASLHGDPQIEFQRQTRASELLPVPPPIGWSPLSFRSCFIPGKPYNRISPFGLEPEEANIQVADDLPLPAAAGLWHLMQEAFRHISALHNGGTAHGDLELHNLIVCPAPLELHLIDFENSREQGEADHDQWVKWQAEDLQNILREAVYLQCSLGRQEGPMAEAADRSLDRLLLNPARFRRAIQRKAGL